MWPPEERADDMNAPVVVDLTVGASTTVGRLEMMTTNMKVSRSHLGSCLGKGGGGLACGCGGSASKYVPVCLFVRWPACLLWWVQHSRVVDRLPRISREPQRSSWIARDTTATRLHRQRRRR